MQRWEYIKKTRQTAEVEMSWRIGISNICELIFKQDEDFLLVIFGKLYPVEMSYSDGTHTSWVENTGRVDGLTEAGREIWNGKQ